MAIGDTVLKQFLWSGNEPSSSEYKMIIRNNSPLPIE